MELDVLPYRPDIFSTSTVPVADSPDSLPMSVPFTPSPFRAAPWLPGRHLQTLGARFLRSERGVPLVRERLPTPDGDFVDLDFPFEPPRSNERDQRPIVLLLHGLEGSARSKYALETYRHLARHGLACVGLNFRSCSGELNRLARLYHSGDTGDLAHVLKVLTARFPNRRKGAIGFSIGGNALLKYLGECGVAARTRLDAAAAVSAPYDLAAGADYLERLGGRVYTWYLIRKLQRKIHAKAQTLPASVHVPRALAAKSFRDFDDAATAPLHGFTGAEDYYQRSSSGRSIEDIQIPTLLIHSADDPFLPAKCIPRRQAHENPNIVTAFANRGGHVGFVTGMPWRPIFWAEREVGRFMAEMLMDTGGR